MGGIGNWFRKIGAAFGRFMSGRYGTDKLNFVILWSSVAVVFIAVFVPHMVVRLLLTAVAYALMGWGIFRAMSRNTYRRYRENRWFLMQLDRIKDRKHKYFSCPRCHQPVRVPRKKGKISITCPKCKEKFIRKT